MLYTRPALTAETVQRLLAEKATRAQAATAHLAALHAGRPTVTSTERHAAIAARNLELAVRRTARTVTAAAQARRAYENYTACEFTDYRVVAQLWAEYEAATALISDFTLVAVA